MTESELQKRIMVAVSPEVAIFRTPAGQYYQGKLLRTPEYGLVLTNLRTVKVLHEGFSDLAGFRRSDGRAVLIEVKTKRGRVSKEQESFIEIAQRSGCLAGIARSVEDALEIVEGN